MDRRPCGPTRENRQPEVNSANGVPRARRHQMDRNTAGAIGAGAGPLDVANWDETNLQHLAIDF
jgi:hypothetical protein